MGVTLRSMILAALLTIFAAFIYRMSVNMLPEVTDDTLLKYPTFVAEGFHGENYDGDGKLTATIDSPHVEYFEHSSLITMQKPRGVWHDYNKDSSTPERWQITAYQGSYIVDQKATLEGSVTLVPLHQDPNIKRISTEAIEYDLTAGIISSDHLIVIEGPNFVNYGTGFKADLNTDTVTISGEPHARYYPVN